MDIPESLFFAGLLPGKIFKFVNPEFTTATPHYHICLKEIDGGVILLACCTSQFEKRKKYLEVADLPYETLVWVKPDIGNKLKKNTYVDCNRCFKLTKTYLYSKFINKKLRETGQVKQDHYEQIVNGMIASPTIEEEIKEIIKLSEE